MRHSLFDFLRAPGATAWAIGAIVVVQATSASASCGNRPGTPNDIEAVAKSSNSIEVKWRNTTGKGMNKSGSTSSDATHRMYFDMYFRDGNQRGLSPSRDLTGTGPFNVNYGMKSAKTFDGLSANTKYCFALRARTEGGTQGCISKITSGWACATTLAAGASPPPQVSSPGGSKGGAPGAPKISVQAKSGNSVVITGNSFKPNAAVTVRVTDQSLRSIFVMTIGNQRITSSGSGALNLTFNGLCKSPGLLYFAAQDGRTVPASVDRTGTLWSNTASMTCT